jgi:hypothetical protein
MIRCTIDIPFRLASRLSRLDLVRSAGSYDVVSQLRAAESKNGSRTSEGETVFMCLRVAFHPEHLAARMSRRNRGRQRCDASLLGFPPIGRPILLIIAEIAFRALFLHNDKHASA